MFERNGKLKYLKKTKIIKISKNDLKEGVNCLKDHMVIKVSQSIILTFGIILLTHILEIDILEIEKTVQTVKG